MGHQLSEVSGGSSARTTDQSVSDHSQIGSNPARASGKAAFGTIEAVSQDYGPGAVDWDPDAKSSTVAEGNDACKYKDQLEEQVRLINESATPYRPLGPNSNTAAETALKNVGIKPVIPKGVWAPGHGMHIRKKAKPKAKKSFGKLKVGKPCIPCILKSLHL